MFLTAHRVRSKDGKEGVNAFHYHHGDLPWRPPNPRSEWDLEQPNKDHDPGILVSMNCEVEPGGHAVCSYVSMMAPDNAKWEMIAERFALFVHLERTERKAFPWVGVFDECVFRVNMDSSVAPNWQEELRLLFLAMKKTRMSSDEANRVIAEVAENRSKGATRDEIIDARLERLRQK